MRGIGRPRRLPLIPQPSASHHLCADCGLDLCEDLKLMGFEDQLTHQVHAGVINVARRSPHALWRCTSCEIAFRKAR